MDFAEFEKHVQESLVPKLEQTNIFVSITPMSKEKVDVKFAVELGLAIMMDKPIIAVIQPGTPIPEKLAKVVDRFVELDLNDANGKQRLLEAIMEMKSTLTQGDQS